MTHRCRGKTTGKTAVRTQDSTQIAAEASAMTTSQGEDAFQDNMNPCSLVFGCCPGVPVIHAAERTNEEETQVGGGFSTGQVDWASQKQQVAEDGYPAAGGDVTSDPLGHSYCIIVSVYKHVCVA